MWSPSSHFVVLPHNGLLSAHAATATTMTPKKGARLMWSLMRSTNRSNHARPALLCRDCAAGLLLMA